MTFKNNLFLILAALCLSLLACDNSCITKRKLSSGGTETQHDSSFDSLNHSDLSKKLSQVMLPLEEYEKLRTAILQTAMGLLMAQGTGLGEDAIKQAEEKLQKDVDEKYSRDYFSDMNSGSMKELSESELRQILSFYNTSAGKKFLQVSPKIIENTMKSVQSDLSVWLPQTVQKLIAEMKAEDNSKKIEDNKKN